MIDPILSIVIRAAYERGGNLTAENVAQLAPVYPKLPTVIKWSQSARVKCSIGAVANVIAEGERLGDYCRELFFPVDFLDKFKCGEIDLNSYR